MITGKKIQNCKLKCVTSNTNFHRQVGTSVGLAFLLPNKQIRTQDDHPQNEQTKNINQGIQDHKSEAAVIDKNELGVGQGKNKGDQVLQETMPKIKERSNLKQINQNTVDKALKNVPKVRCQHKNHPNIQKQSKSLITKNAQKPPKQHKTKSKQKHSMINVSKMAKALVLEQVETKNKCFNEEYERRSDMLLFQDGIEDYDSLELERLNPPDPINDQLHLKQTYEDISFQLMVSTQSKRNNQLNEADGEKDDQTGFDEQENKFGIDMSIFKLGAEELLSKQYLIL